MAAWIRASTLESTACIEEATAVCTECETMVERAANPVEPLAAVLVDELVGTRAADEAWTFPE